MLYTCKPWVHLVLIFLCDIEWDSNFIYLFSIELINSHIYWWVYSSLTSLQMHLNYFSLCVYLHLFLCFLFYSGSLFFQTFINISQLWHSLNFWNFKWFWSLLGQVSPCGNFSCKVFMEQRDFPFLFWDALNHK